MPVHTVGELIEILKTFDKNTPILVAGSNYYQDINLNEALLFRVIAVIDKDNTEPGPSVYIDADPSHPHSFDAVVL